jgi:dolichyl-phosphate-mannose--protein O-mannosyl transferase
VVSLCDVVFVIEIFHNYFLVFCHTRRHYIIVVRSLKLQSFSLMKVIGLLPLAYIAHSLAESTGDPVTCGSAVKLLHKETGHHLHSHAIAWGSGSGQQSVTTTGSTNDVNSLWLVKESSDLPSCEVGVPVKCGDTIRMEHVGTGKNLHSHLFRYTYFYSFWS